MITFTDAAVDKLKEFSQDYPTSLLRVGVMGGGCSGLNIRWDLLNRKMLMTKHSANTSRANWILWLTRKVNRLFKVVLLTGLRISCKGDLNLIIQTLKDPAGVERVLVYERAEVVYI